MLWICNYIVIYTRTLCSSSIIMYFIYFRKSGFSKKCKLIYFVNNFSIFIKLPYFVSFVKIILSSFSTLELHTLENFDFLCVIKTNRR